MTLLEYLRNKAFWTLDSLKGNPVRKYLSVLQLFEMGG